MLELLGILGVGFIKSGLDVYKYKYRFFKYLSQIIFNEVLGLHLDKETIKKHSKKLANSFKVDEKSLSFIGCYKAKRKYFSVFSKLGLLLKKLDKETFEVLFKKGYIDQYLKSIDKIKEFVSLIRITQKISNTILEFMGVIDMDTRASKEEKIELFMELFLIIKESDLKRCETVFYNRLEGYTHTVEYQTHIITQQKNLLKLLLDTSDIDNKSKKILKKLSRPIEDMAIDSLFQPRPEESCKKDVKNLARVGTNMFKGLVSPEEVRISDFEEVKEKKVLVKKTTWN